MSEVCYHGRKISHNLKANALPTIRISMNLRHCRYYVTCIVVGLDGLLNVWTCIFVRRERQRTHAMSFAPFVYMTINISEELVNLDSREFY